MIVKETTKLPEGFSARPAKMNDLQEVLRVANLDALELLGKADTSADEIRNDWEDEEFDLAKDSQLLLFPDGELAGVAQIFKFEKPPVNPYLWMRIKPGYMDHAVGDFLLAWLLRRSAGLLPQIPSKLRVVARIFNVSGYAPLKALYERHQFAITRHSLQMQIDLAALPDEVQWPEGLSLSPFDEARDMADVYRADNEAFEDHFGHVPESFEDGFPRFQHSMVKGEGYDPSLWFVVRDGDKIAGLALCRKHSWEDEAIGWVRSLSVRRPWRRRGLGQALLLHCFREYYKRGLRKVALGVDASSLTGATRLYERAGMQVNRIYDRYEKEIRPGKQLATTKLD